MSLVVVVVELELFFVEELPVFDPEFAVPSECMLLLEAVVVTVSVLSAQALRSAAAATSVKARKEDLFMCRAIAGFGGERRDHSVAEQADFEE